MGMDRKDRIMRLRHMSRIGAAVALAALSAAPALAQHPGNTAAAAQNAAAGLALQQQQLNNAQQIYNQGQLTIQGSTQAHVQSQRMLSTLSERNQAQLDAQAPKTPSSPTTTGTLHF
jgi:hypothetical protein